MTPHLDLPLALLRGRFMEAVARMEHTGTPVNADLVRQIKTNWKSIRQQFIEDVDADYGVYVGTRFSQKNFRQWLEREAIDWPIRDPKSGSLRLDKKTFKAMAQRYPQVEPLRNLRQMLSQFRDLVLPVGMDGYNRTMLSPFLAKTSRNQPSTTGFIFGLSKCSRQLIQPTPGNALVYIDWAQQEFGIGAALSEDTAMMDAYRTGDPYLAFAKQAGAVPEDATKETHAAAREQYKQCALGVQYGMGAQSLAERLGISVADARVLLAIHRQTYRKFWKWSDAALDYAHLYGELYTVFGWRIQVMPDTTERTLRNFPVQSNAAEMLRLACCMLTEQGTEVCAPIHDAVLIEAPTADIKEVAASAESIMAEASAVVLSGFTLNSDRMYITESMPWNDKKGKEVWDKLIRHCRPRKVRSAVMSDIASLSLDMPEAIMAIATQGPVGITQGRSIQGRFLRGPVPLDWLKQAAKLPGRAFHAGVALWVLNGFQQTGTVKQGQACFEISAWIDMLRIGRCANWKRQVLCLWYAKGERRDGDTPVVILPCSRHTPPAPPQSDVIFRKLPTGRSGCARCTTALKKPQDRLRVRSSWLQCTPHRESGHRHGWTDEEVLLLLRGKVRPSAAQLKVLAQNWIRIPERSPNCWICN